MTLYETIDWLKKIALKHPNIGSASEGNIYEYMNANPSVKYGVFFITQGTHSQDEMFNHFEFTLFYVDRLVDDMEENRLQIQSIGKEILSNILTFFCEEFDAECENINFQPFTQRFVDETAGIYSTITIDVPKDVICPEEYWNENWVAPVTVIRNQDKRVVFTENGTYTIDYDPTTYTGLGNVEVDVNIDVDSYYNQGKTDGVNEQKSKLESISITENGVYSKEDGYNHIEVNVPDLNGSYDEGYEQGQADIAANARVLDVTENGVYKSKYSDKTLLTEPTGVYENGDLFFDYAYLKNIQYNTNIYPMSNTKIEIWWKYDGIKEENEGCIIGCQNWGYANSIFKIGWNFGDNRLLASINDDKIFIPFIEGWNHIVMSYADGLWLNGVKIGNFPSNITDDMDKKEPICINGYYGNSRMNSDYFGMVKINDVVFIPTENGFLNTSTNELLPIRREGEYTYTSVVPKYDEPTGELYKTINVNVIPKINLQKTGLKLGRSTFTEVPEWVDFEGITDMSYMFDNCGNLQTIPEIDTSNVINMDYMFYNCPSLQTIPLINTSKVSNMSNMFNGCRNLQTIPLLNTSNVSNISYMFASCTNLQTIPKIDTSNVTDMSQMFYDFGGIKTLVSLPKFNCQKVTNMYRYFSYYADGMSALTDVGGWENLKCDWNDRYGLPSCPNLTYQSCINILNGLYDFVGNGESTTKTLKVHPNFLTTVGDEISIGTSRGWIITA